MVVWKPDWKKPVNGPKCPVFKWSTKSRDFFIWIPDTLNVRYSDDSVIQVFGDGYCNCNHYKNKFRSILRNTHPPQKNLGDFLFFVLIFNFGSPKDCFFGYLKPMCQGWKATTLSPLLKKVLNTQERVCRIPYRSVGRTFDILPVVDYWCKTWWLGGIGIAVEWAACRKLEFRRP